eukprot:2580640-Rhodomonas_salina.1
MRPLHTPCTPPVSAPHTRVSHRRVLSTSDCTRPLHTKRTPISAPHTRVAHHCALNVPLHPPPNMGEDRMRPLHTMRTPCAPPASAPRTPVYNRVPRHRALDVKREESQPGAGMWVV